MYKDIENKNLVKREDKMITFFRVCVLVIYSLIFLTAYALSNYSANVAGESLNYGLMLLLLQILYTVASFKMIGPTELGARLFFGRPICALRSGLVFIPIWICQMKTETRLVIQDELPADPEKIFRPKEDESEVEIPEGMKPPIRIPFGYPEKQTEDPLDNRITADVSFFIRWHIVDYLRFLITIGDRDEAIRQMEDAAIAKLMDELAKITPAVALKDLGKYNKMLAEAIRGRITNWGIELDNAEIKAINFSRTLNKAILSVPQADLNRKAKILEAEGEKRRLELEGEGRGLAEKAALTGRAKGLKGMAKHLDISSEKVLDAETARSITQNPGQKTIVAGIEGFKEILSLASAIKE